MKETGSCNAKSKEYFLDASDKECDISFERGRLSSR